MKVTGIYQIINLDNGKRYVGSAVNIRNRWTCHTKHLMDGTHSNTHLGRSWAKHGESAFAFCILERVNDPGRLIEREQYWIDKLNPEFNIRKVAQSNQGLKATTATKRKMSKAQKERWDNLPADERKKRSDRIQKIGANATIGMHRTPEQKEHLRQKMKNRYFSPEHRARITEGNKRAWADPESKKERLKKARSLTKEQVFRILNAHEMGESKRSLGEQFGVDRRMISYIVNGSSYKEYVAEWRTPNP